MELRNILFFAAFEMKSINMLGNGILAPFPLAISVD